MGQPPTILTMARRYKSHQAGGALLFVLAGLVYVVVRIAQFVYDNAVFFVSAAVIIGAVVAGVAIWRRKQRRLAMEEESARRHEYQRRLEARLAVVRISDRRVDYLISNDDYRRGTPRENFYRKTFLLPLLATFANRCASCGTSENGVDIDHFVFSKNEGGTFAMFHREGFWINNAIPLCQSCNRRKLDHSYRDFFTAERLAEILEKNAEMTKRLNENGTMPSFRPSLALAQPSVGDVGSRTP